MVAPTLAFALIGLSAMSSAMPTPNAVKERQTLGPPISSFGMGSGETTTPCIADVPEEEQPPCVWQSSGGDLSPSNKRDFVLPSDADSQLKELFGELEERLEYLQNKDVTSKDEKKEIKDIQKALLKLLGIETITAPDGSTSTFVPGKRADAAPDCRTSKLKQAELDYEEFLQADELSFWEAIQAYNLYKYLKSCGIEIQKSPDGTTTTLTPDNPTPGGAITPEPSTPGSSITPDPTTPGGSINPSDKRGKIVPDLPIPGGTIKPSDKRGEIVPDVPVWGGKIVPDFPVWGGKIKPSD